MFQLFGTDAMRIAISNSQGRARATCTNLATLIQGFGGADTIAFARLVRPLGRGAGALSAGTRLGLRISSVSCD